MLDEAQVEQALASRTVDRPIKSLLKVRGPLQFGDYQWNDNAIPPGPTWIRVDLGTQILSVFRAGHEIGTAVIVYGGDNKQTPPGKLRILAKARDHVSSLYDAPMPFTLRLTGDGVSIHGSRSLRARRPTAASAYLSRSPNACSMPRKSATRSSLSRRGVAPVQALPDAAINRFPNGSPRPPIVRPALRSEAPVHNRNRRTIVAIAMFAASPLLIGGTTPAPISTRACCPRRTPNAPRWACRH